MLLPLPVAKTRAMSLENHLALAAMRNGHGNVDQMSCLLKVVYLAYFMHEAIQGRGDLNNFRAAEAALERCVTRAENQQGWTLPDEDHDGLAGMLVMHDEQLASVPAHLFASAWSCLENFVKNDIKSPIAGL